jgi:preprotein translocase subunit SecF
MDSKSKNGDYIKVPIVYKKTTYSNHSDKKKCINGIKYVLIVSGIVTIILMVVFGVKNDETLINKFENNTISITVNGTDTNLNNTLATEETELNIESVEEYDQGEGEDVLISNKTVVVNGSSDSIVISY